MDAARSAVRLGADVTVVYRRTKKEMPANEWEIISAEEEGVEFSYLTTQVEVIAAKERCGRISGLRCIRNELGPPDESGRRRPQPIPGSEFLMEADTVIVAIGQKVEQSIREAGFEFLTKAAILSHTTAVLLYPTYCRRGRPYRPGNSHRGYSCRKPRCQSYYQLPGKQGLACRSSLIAADRFEPDRPGSFLILAAL